jgi:predicted ribosomally synthesized peptide with SipW-like signal peptide
MKKMLISSLAAIGIAGLIGGGTFASWSDYQVQEGNDSGAGILKLVMDDYNQNGSGPMFDNLRLAPGQGKDKVIQIASSDGDSVPDANLFVTFQNLEDFENGCNSTNSEKDADPTCDLAEDTGEFQDMATIKVKTRPHDLEASKFCGSNFDDQSIGQTIYQGTIADLVDLGKIQLNQPGSPLEAGDAMCLGAEVKLPSSAGNAVQGDSVSFDFRVDLEQVQ